MIVEETEKNCLEGTIPILAILLERDLRVSSAYLCHDGAKQVYKIRGEGDHFCGYRNIQMQLRNMSPELLKSNSTYPILEIQVLIEKAWESGFNSSGFVETGGIVDTRKHIGTSEVRSHSIKEEMFHEADHFVPGPSTSPQSRHSMFCSRISRKRTRKQDRL